MTFLNTVTIVASPRARAGKTLLARLLVDYHRQENRAFQAFDLNTGEDSLAQFLGPGRGFVLPDQTVEDDRPSRLRPPPARTRAQRDGSG